MSVLNNAILINGKTTNTYYLADVLQHMQGDALEAVKHILIQSLEVNKIDARGAEAAKLFTKWHTTGELNKKLICTMNREEHRAEILQYIEEELEELEAAWEEVGPQFLDEESYRLQKYYAWVSDPIKYWKKCN